MICAEMHVLLLFCVPKKVTKKGHQRSQLKRFSRTGHRHSCQNLISSHLRWIPTAHFPLKLLLAARSQLPVAFFNPPHAKPSNSWLRQRNRSVWGREFIYLQHLSRRDYISVAYNAHHGILYPVGIIFFIYRNVIPTGYLKWLAVLFVATEI